MSDPSLARKVRVGVIGTSKRAAAYFRNIPSDLRPGIKLVALADPNPSNREKFQRLFSGGTFPQIYSSGEEMFTSEDLDAVVISSPNRFHVGDAKQALAAGATTLLEKPVAISVAECGELWNAQQNSAIGTAVVGFVLRYTPFYSKVKEIVDSGQLGEILTINADECLGTMLTTGFHKGWRKNDYYSGGFIVEKCCHDFDILNWIVGANVQRVYSVGNRKHFIPDQAKRHERFDEAALPQFDADYGDLEIKQTFFTPNEGSPYDVPSDPPDHQSVILEYEDGTLCTFNACMGQPRSSRQIKIFGTGAALEGDIADSRIVVRTPHQQGNGWDSEEITVPIDESGHKGGDSVIGNAFWNAAAARTDTLSRAGVKEGIDAVLVGLAADQSRKSGSPVELNAMRHSVFGSAEGTA